LIPSRKIKASNKLSTRGKHNSSKMFRMIPWESTLERDFIKILDYDQTIIHFEFQPVEINYFFQGKKRMYYPDFLVRKSDMKVYIFEVKAYSKLNHPKNLIKYQVGKKYCSENNMIYAVVTEKDIRQGYLIENIDLLTEARRDSYSTRIMVEILKTVEEIGIPLSVAELRSNLIHIEEPEFRCNLFHLIYTQKLKADLISYPINDEFVIERRCK
jgi:predicted nuclease of restriction endonuclease-like RecB superfamily